MHATQALYHLSYIPSPKDFSSLGIYAIDFEQNNMVTEAAGAQSLPEGVKKILSKDQAIEQRGAT